MSPRNGPRPLFRGPVFGDGPVPERGRLATALMLLLGVTLGGTLGFAEIEGWSLWDAFYFTLVTITTVGYGDQGLSEAGRKFASLLMVGGVAAASYSFALVVQASIERQIAWRKRMQNRIDKLSGHTIVCGYGRMGSFLASMLESEKVSVVVIEQDPTSFQHAIANGHLAIEGAASEDLVLLAAGLARASCVVSAVDSIAENVLVAMTAKELRPEAYVYARAERQAEVAKLKRAGADRVLSPFQSGAREIAQHITNPTVADFLSRASTSEGDVALATIVIEAGSPLVGRTLGEYGRQNATRLSFVALERPGKTTDIPPRGTELVCVGDHLIVAGDPEQISDMSAQARGRSAA